MSEYQYYEFVAVDRQLTRDEMDQLRSISTGPAYPLLIFAIPTIGEILKQSLSRCSGIISMRLFMIPTLRTSVLW